LEDPLNTMEDRLIDYRIHEQTHRRRQEECPGMGQEACME